MASHCCWCFSFCSALLLFSSPLFVRLLQYYILYDEAYTVKALHDARLVYCFLCIPKFLVQHSSFSKCWKVLLQSISSKNIHIKVQKIYNWKYYSNFALFEGKCMQKCGYGTTLHTEVLKAETMLWTRIFLCEHFFKKDKPMQK